MAINMLLTLKVLQFVTQLRRRVRPRTREGSVALRPLGTDALGLSAVTTRPHAQARGSVRNTTPVQPRSCTSNAITCTLSAAARATARRASAAPDLSGEQAPPYVQRSFAFGFVLSLSSSMPSCVDHLSTVAGNNKLFLKHDNAPVLEACTLHQTIRLLLTVRETLGIFLACRPQHGHAWLVARALDRGLAIDDVFLANYHHLLLQLQAELVHVVTRKALEALLRAGHDKRQRKLLAWFAEFAEKPRPLSTSFPWTVKPSLAVLWGVCWMFYDRESDEPAAKADTRVRQNKLLQQLDFPHHVPWNAPASSDYLNLGLELIGAQPLHATQQANLTAGLDNVFQARGTETWQSDLSPLSFRLPSSEEHIGAIASLRYDHAPPQMPGQSTYYTDNLPLFPVQSHDSSFLPHDPGSPLTAFPHLGSTDDSPNAWQLPYASLPPNSRRHLIHTAQTPSIRVISSAGSELAQPQPDFAAYGTSIIYHQQPQASLQVKTNLNFKNNQLYNMTSQISPDTTTVQVPQHPIKHERTSSMASISNVLTPISMPGSRSPLLSPTAGEGQHISTEARSHSRNISSEDGSSQDGDEDGSLRKNFSYKRAEEPPRNQEGKLTCVHSECEGQLFDRKCEWSKHMDKHDRPYKCTVAGCEKLQGFTYSGGLLRHEREVHKMHGGTKKALFCPFHDCKRSSGAGFTRKENLAEHIRRVHRRTSMSADMHGLVIRREMSMDGGLAMAESQQSQAQATSSSSAYRRAVEYDELMSIKRKRASDSVMSEHDSEDLREEVKRLRHENEEKDSRLRQLEQAVMALQRR
ncbi:hypothetical protein ACEQ8H_007965 [Pleosporales sp. CAS-2024a]